MGRVGEVQWESGFGTTFPAYYAMFAERHMHEFGTTRRDLAEVAIKNHFYGARNPFALFQKEITLEKALASEEVATPFTVYDCCANADGAACVILASEARAKEITAKTVWLDGMGCATASMSVLRRPNLVGLPSAERAAAEAYAMAGVWPGDIKVADVHDCFTVAEIMAYEDLLCWEAGISERRRTSGEGGGECRRRLKAKGTSDRPPGVDDPRSPSSCAARRRCAPVPARRGADPQTWVASASTASFRCCEE
jgi:acetyl-CoA C-acetyltransferase